uniref:Uncharacterized protein AlNc14C160G7760 n=1 Tax=Albugo laibachii Nc14 TaxID=890382 RepID=F0WMS4_9STRA|nr:conserved hypothetical protein [Albugo laibachii Nc14]|eukprot:CCA22609.1 conserved hypothetical protein [Albugo laibachii Nc14]
MPTKFFVLIGANLCGTLYLHKDTPRKVMRTFELKSKNAAAVYENREPCHLIALIQLGINCTCMILFHRSWWCFLFGIIVALLGYSGSRMPATHKRITLIHLYFLGNWAMLLLQMISMALLIGRISAWNSFNIWKCFLLLSKSFILSAQFYFTYLGMQRSQAYRAELWRNPPPIEKTTLDAGSGHSSLVI